MTAVAALAHAQFSIERDDLDLPIFVAPSRDVLAVRAGTVIRIEGRVHAFAQQTPVATATLTPGKDYVIAFDADGRPAAHACHREPGTEAIGGFHFAPGGNAAARAGGDSEPAINPCSIWDRWFRPACPDPRGMALVTGLARPFWCDIYLLGASHLDHGTSTFGVEIADGASLPQAVDGKGGRTKKLDYATAAAIMANHRKQLLTYDEFRAAAIGVQERSAVDDDPEITGLDAARTSRFGIMQATGNLWIWGTDGDPDDPRPAIFGGSWFAGGKAGSRYANLGYWPESSVDIFSARGRCDHLNPA